ncbi:MAG: CoA transferase, partial [Ilumatobacteraceae bacterium]
MAGPLQGLKIIEIAGIGPGPFAAMMLADMGADVLRVDRAAAVRGIATDPGLDILQRGRRNIALDLKHPKGRDVALQLIQSADIV